MGKEFGKEWMERKKKRADRERSNNKRKKPTGTENKDTRGNKKLKKSNNGNVCKRPAS